jgi:hypothetical protein
VDHFRGHWQLVLQARREVCSTGFRAFFGDLVSQSRTEDLGALHAEFEGCVHPLVKLALLQNGENRADDVSLSPSAQWLYTKGTHAPLDDLGDLRRCVAKYFEPEY